MSKDKPAPNDQRSDVKNPNNPAHAADRRNRVGQGQPAPPPAQSDSKKK